MARKYYQVCYRLDGAVSYLIWYTNDSDGVVVGSDGRVLSFPTRSDMRAYAQRWGLAFEDEEPSDYELEALALWLSKRDGAAIDCRLFLGAWNLFDDVAASTGCEAFGRSSRETGDVYDKLFWGSNFPAMTPPGERYVPVWSDEEIVELHQILSEGIALVRNTVTAIP